ncbi:tight adherence protein B [Nakamurella panacisegetis]|uniref:Tight adherence protein B n=1 Tax=Nakamurella panacisegetis TaxID=1090615 RepID=A0A1H0HNJ3_9ACTN|nr:type II secretion system F family protein [Nakamurella panacisegetis]SDO20755.1 tight adherence protein B [Nakamurella panacisegetis]
MISYAGLVLMYLSLAAAVAAVWSGGPRISPDRRTQPGAVDRPSPLAKPSARLIAAVDGGLRRSGWQVKVKAALDSAGKNVQPGDFVMLLMVGMLVAVVAGLVLGLGAGCVLLALVVPVVAKVGLGYLAGRRRAAFADQLDDSLQLLAGSLRAGHSLLRAVDAVSREAEEPTSIEFSRILNETRVGRELGDSLEDTADRMRSDDFSWVAQAIAIHREVGGDLAEVLDTVGHTIRERNQIRRQVKALSAEGRLSGIVLILLPIGVSGFLMMTNPGYLSKLTGSVLGWGLISAAVILVVVGALWLRKVVSFRF